MVLIPTFDVAILNYTTLTLLLLVGFVAILLLLYCRWAARYNNKVRVVVPKDEQQVLEDVIAIAVLTQYNFFTCEALGQRS